MTNKLAGAAAAAAMLAIASAASAQNVAETNPMGADPAPPAAAPTPAPAPAPTPAPTPPPAPDPVPAPVPAPAPPPPPSGDILADPALTGPGFDAGLFDDPLLNEYGTEANLQVEQRERGFDWGLLGLLGLFGLLGLMGRRQGVAHTAYRERDDRTTYVRGGPHDPPPPAP